MADQEDSFVEMEKRRTLSDLPRRFSSGGYPFNEKGRCHWCGGEIKPPRRTWCSQDCVTEWTIRRSPAAVRDAVYARDKGVCAECGLDTTAEKRERYEANGRIWHEHWGKTAAWDADHVVPVWKGGGLAGLAGYQTLCVPCHQKKTAAEAAERAQLRKTTQHTEQMVLEVAE